MYLPPLRTARGSARMGDDATMERLSCMFHELSPQSDTLARRRGASSTHSAERGLGGGSLGMGASQSSVPAMMVVGHTHSKIELLKGRLETKLVGHAEQLLRKELEEEVITHS